MRLYIKYGYQGVPETKNRWNGLCIFVAVNHKPVPTVGPTMLSRTVDLMLHLEVLIKIKEYFRDIQTGKKDPVFVSWSGRKMDLSIGDNSSR